jgi:hypothetical protein
MPHHESVPRPVTVRKADAHADANDHSETDGHSNRNADKFHHGCSGFQGI